MSEVIIKDQLEGDLIFNTGLCNTLMVTFFTKFKPDVYATIPSKFRYMGSFLQTVKAGGEFVLSEVCISIGNTPVLPLISDIVWLRGEHPNKFEAVCDDVSIKILDLVNKDVVGTLRISLKCLEQVLARL